MRARLLVTVFTVAALAITASGTLYTETGRADQSAPQKPAADASPAAQSGQTVRAAQNGRLALDFNPLTAEVSVTDLSSGTVWSSNPVDRANDSIAKGVKKQDLNAQLLLDYVDTLNKPFQLNNFIGSIQEKSFTWKQIENGIEVVFEFSKAGFTVPVQYLLKDDAFTAAIASDRIVQSGKYRLVNIGLLPFFGAGSIKDEGYLFVPDGSGALIRFNNSKSLYKSYNERVYGGDQAIDAAERTRSTEDVRLPVFGLKKNDHAFLAVIHQGAYQAGITAEGSRKSNSYNAVSSYLNMTEFETNILMAGSLNEKQVLRGSQSAAGGKSYEIRYYFLNGAVADYSGMAARYRSYLAQEQGVKPVSLKQSDQIPVMMDFLGGVQKRETFLGFPYHTVEALTSFSDLKTVTKRLIDSGMDHLSIRYEGWMENGAKDKVPTSLAAEGKLGSDKSFRELIADMEKKGVAFYPVVDPVRFYKSGHGFNKFFDAAKSISRAPTLKSEFLLGSGMKDKKTPPWYLLKPESVKEALDRFSASAGKGGLKHAALQSIGSMVYSDFRRDTLPKNGTGQIWEEALKAAGSRIPGLSFDHANAYTFTHAESLTDVPLYSSGFDVEDEAVPFYSMAVSGLIPAFSEPVNLSGSSKRYLLRLIETGTYPSYRFIANDGSLLIGTDYDSLYSGDFKLWLEDVAAQYKEMNQALLPVMGQPITRHEEIGKGVFRTTYANGRSAVVNYSEETVTVDHERIEPDGYLVR